MPRLCVSALSGGGGKTLLALGLARAFGARGLAVQPFKKGPDYIDAAWLSLAAGRPASNLDPFMLPPERLRAQFLHVLQRVAAHRAEAVLALLEGNRGLFDGMDAAGSCSTAALARVLECPILLSVDCTKMTRTAAALVRGVLSFEPGLRFAGVVLNQVGSARHERLLRRALETYTDVPVLGALPRLAENPLPERHMGIASAGVGLAPEARTTLDRLGALAAAHVDLDRVLAAAGGAPALEAAGPFWPVPDAVPAPDGNAVPRPRIGYVRDSALWFYYEENLEALERAGAELVRLALVGGAQAWPAVRGAAVGGKAALPALDGLYLGGGFPEDCAADLSASPQLRALAAWADAGMPIYAECGGFMLLARGIERDGRLWPMGNVFPVTAQFCGKPQGLGYVHGTVTADNPYFPKGLELKGHEFHYSRCRWQGAPPRHALRLCKGRGMGALPPEEGNAPAALDGLLHRNVWASYTHIFAPAVPCWAQNFTAAARRFAAAAVSGGRRV
ncbi:cobyrinate a,c-diamide synthase [uncultured Desulfovibrio sp.]|uniref:cobyrinate a,c-diamide synthase n=1 Tax=uncultured Desulfovibrio sp. TaxID=167968 RepID=UPI00261F23F3|nr:cobyrinate a,c-diamide synthase [uncultured Desulfovibrio sp.]